MKKINTLGRSGYLEEFCSLLPDSAVDLVGVEGDFVELGQEVLELGEPLLGLQLSLIHI